MGGPLGELEKDEKGLWRKKEEVFDKPQTWGRETVEYSDPELARAEGNKGPKWGRKGVVGWGVQGKFGGRGDDVGLSVLQRGEVNQAMEKNDKGLWVKKKVAEEDSQAPVAKKGHWICPLCWTECAVALEFCRRDDCNGRRPASAIGADAGGQRKVNACEDPRLEAAKPKGRGTADAAKEALKALEKRRRQEIDAKEQMGMMRRRQLGGGDGYCEAAPGLNRGGGRVTTLNSSQGQVRPSKRQGGVTNWQGVQKTDEDAKKVVAKAVGGNVENSGAPLRVEDSELSAMRRQKKKDEGDDIADRIARSISRSRSRSRSGSKSDEEQGKFAWEESGSEPASPVAKDGDAGEVVVDFF